MRRGEIWTVAGAKDYAGKPRPAVVIQDDTVGELASVTVCFFTSDPSESPLFRLLVTPSEGNGLRTTSRLMVDKITTVPLSKVGIKVGRLEEENVLRLNRALLVFFGLAGSPRNASAD